MGAFGESTTVHGYTRPDGVVIVTLGQLPESALPDGAITWSTQVPWKVTHPRPAMPVPTEPGSIIRAVYSHDGREFTGPVFMWLPVPHPHQRPNEVHRWTVMPPEGKPGTWGVDSDTIVWWEPWHLEQGDAS